MNYNSLNYFEFIKGLNMTYLLKDLDYKYSDLEPFFDKKTMEIHHTKHHQTYINNINIVIKNTQFDNLSTNDLINKLDKIPKDKKIFLKNNLGGHINHSIFWEILKLNTTPNGLLKTEIEKKFNSISNFKKEFEKVAMQHFGSGWVWLVIKNNNLSIIATNNQDNPIMNISDKLSGFPILGLDLWEHAYYLKHQNNKINYIKDFWSVLNWDQVLIRFNTFIQK